MTNGLYLRTQVVFLGFRIAVITSDRCVCKLSQSEMRALLSRVCECYCISIGSAELRSGTHTLISSIWSVEESVQQEGRTN
jgi:hypothetical protein